MARLISLFGRFEGFIFSSAYQSRGKFSKSLRFEITTRTFCIWLCCGSQQTHWILTPNTELRATNTAGSTNQPLKHRRPSAVQHEPDLADMGWNKQIGKWEKTGFDFLAMTYFLTVLFSILIDFINASRLDGRFASALPFIRVVLTQSVFCILLLWWVQSTQAWYFERTSELNGKPVY